MLFWFDLMDWIEPDVEDPSCNTNHVLFFNFLFFSSSNKSSPQTLNPPPSHITESRLLDIIQKLETTDKMNWANVQHTSHWDEQLQTRLTGWVRFNVIWVPMHLIWFFKFSVLKHWLQKFQCILKYRSYCCNKIITAPIITEAKNTTIANYSSPSSIPSRADVHPILARFTAAMTALSCCRSLSPSRHRYPWNFSCKYIENVST